MSERKISRREFGKYCAITGIGLSIPLKEKEIFTSESYPERLKLSLNAFSFDKPLKEGKMTIDNLLEYCARTGFDGVDLTGYYFPGYPAVPSDKFIYDIKRKAFKLGLGISGTGVRNDFTWSDVGKRAKEKQLVKDWIIVAEKLGAPLVRIFAGHLSEENISRDKRAQWIADDIRECAEFGSRHGVMTALQNHNDFLKTAFDVEEMMGMVNSEWNGLLLDIGSYHTPDPYKDILLNSKFAISWQLKEKVFVNDNQVDTDYIKIIDIVRKCGFKGYLPLETLGEGNPEIKVETLLRKVKGVMGKI